MHFLLCLAMLLCVCYNLYIKRKDAHMMKNQKKRSEKAPIQKIQPDNRGLGAPAFRSVYRRILRARGVFAKRHSGQYLMDLHGNFLCSADRAFRFCGDSLNTETKCVQKKV